MKSNQNGTGQHQSNLEENERNSEHSDSSGQALKVEPSEQLNGQAADISKSVAMMLNFGEANNRQQNANNMLS